MGGVCARIMRISFSGDLASDQWDWHATIRASIGAYRSSFEFYGRLGKATTNAYKVRIRAACFSSPSGPIAVSLPRLRDLRIKHNESLGSLLTIVEK